MAWDDELPIVLRVMINDLADTPTYSDDRLTQVLVVADRLVKQALEFQVDYVVDVEDIDITSDPNAPPTRDDNFINLVCAQAACIIDRGAAIGAASQAIRVRDGSSEVDLRTAFQAKLALLEKGWCAVYQDMKDEYKLSQQGVVVGAA